MIEFYADPVQGWIHTFEDVNFLDLYTDFYKYRTMCRTKLHIYDHPDRRPVMGQEYIGLFDISVFPARAFVPPAVDMDEERQWMAPPWHKPLNLYLDLGDIYNIYDIFIWFVMLSVVGFEVQEEVRRMTSTNVWGRMRLEERGIAFRGRYIRIELFKAYQDPEFQLGTSIRDVAIYQFRNLAQSAPTSANHVWNYPAEWITDVYDPEDPQAKYTYWMSRFFPIQGTLLADMHATILIDLGREVNVAGITGMFKYKPGFYTMEYSLDNVTWTLGYQ